MYCFMVFRNSNLTIEIPEVKTLKVQMKRFSSYLIFCVLGIIFPQTVSTISTKCVLNSFLLNVKGKSQSSELGALSSQSSSNSEEEVVNKQMARIIKAPVSIWRKTTDCGFSVVFIMAFPSCPLSG